ncbi:MAG TPA: hypothetical protein VJ948_07775 [Acidimicrobiia bacterium]|nr:hypothetical protein [Acidimicrobiia bacterium]
MTTTLSENRVESGQLHENSEPVRSPSLDEMLDQTLRAKHDFWIQTVRSDSHGSTDGIHLSTFQTGRGQHVTTLTPREARVLGQRLIRLAWEVDAA